jgi:hypothetical protein
MSMVACLPRLKYCARGSRLHVCQGREPAGQPEIAALPERGSGSEISKAFRLREAGRACAAGCRSKAAAGALASLAAMRSPRHHAGLVALAILLLLLLPQLVRTDVVLKNDYPLKNGPILAIYCCYFIRRGGGAPAAATGWSAARDSAAARNGHKSKASVH